MKSASPQASSQAQRHFERLRKRLAQLNHFSQGSVQDRTTRRGGGAGYQWTRKVAQKTVTVSLTREQYELMRNAVETYRELRHLLRTMETLSRKIIFRNCPHPRRRKRLSNKVLGIN
jgi:hypothetical protein